MENTNINCAVACVNGCVLGDKCPKREYVDGASEFINNTSLEQMLAMAEIARMKKLTQPTKWIIPDDF